MKKKIALLMAMVMLFAVTTAGTLAWLQAETGSVVNTFTVGDLNITLDETNVEGQGRDTANEYKLIPGQKYVKDPIVHIQANSEPCWVFVKLTEERNTLGASDKIIEYSINEGWVLVNEAENIYMYGTNATTPTTMNAGESTASVLAFLADGTNNITINDGLTKEAMPASKEAAPKLTFTAFAIQSANIELADAIAQAVATL